MEPFFSYVSGENILPCCLILFRNDVNIYDKNILGGILRKKGGKTYKTYDDGREYLAISFKKRGRQDHLCDFAALAS